MVGDDVRTALFERALNRVRAAWRDLTSAGRLPTQAPLRPDLPDDDLPASASRSRPVSRVRVVRFRRGRERTSSASPICRSTNLVVRVF